MRVRVREVRSGEWRARGEGDGEDDEPAIGAIKCDVRLIAGIKL